MIIMIMYKNYSDLECDYLDKLIHVVKNSVNNDERRNNRYHKSYLSDLVKTKLVPLKFIKKHYDYKWCWKSITQNPNLTLQFVIEYIDKEWDWKYMSRLHFITNEFINRYHDKPFCWTTITQNPSIHISEDFIMRHYNKNLNWKLLSRHPNISLEFISSTITSDSKYNSYLLWHWWEVSKHPNINAIYINQFKNFNLNWGAIVKNLNIPLEELLDILDSMDLKKWGQWYYLSVRDDITEEIIMKYPHKPWNWWWISKHKNITWDVIKRHPDWNWDWSYVPCNPNITLDIIINNKEYPWKLINITKNINLDMREDWMDKERLKIIAARRIHRFWRDVNYNPNYNRARKKLLFNLELVM